MNYRRDHTAFVLGLFDTGLGAVRSLGYEGIAVIGLDSNPNMPGFKSKFCKAKLCPDPVHQPDELLQFMMNEGGKLDKAGVLIPSSDAFVLFLSRYREELQKRFIFALSTEDVLEAIVNKRKQYEMAERIGTPYPQTCYPESMDDVEKMKDEVEYPAFIKPYYSHLWREKFNNKGFKVGNSQELIERFAEIFPTGLQAMAQSIIIGPNTNHLKVSAYIDDNNEPLALFTLRKIRQYPTDFGVGTLVESINNVELKELGLIFFRGIHYRGIGSIEFKKDDRDGRIKMIELNPRLWQQNYHATVCGMNFPLIQYLDLTGQTPEPLTEFMEGIKWFDATADFQAFWDYFRKGQLTPWGWVQSWITAKSYATFAWNDLRPFFKANKYGLKYLRLPFYLIKNHT
jgi:D-aspartate ligase